MGDGRPYGKGRVMRDPLEGYAVRQHVKPRTEQESDVFRRAVSAAMRQGTAPGEPKPTVVVPHRMTAHPVPRPEVPLILNGVAVTARKPDQAAWNWLLGAITHADSEAERTLRCMDLLAYTLDPDDMRRWQASGVHSAAEIKTAAGVVIRALRQDGEQEVRELHDMAGRAVQHEVQCAGGQVFRFKTGAEARKAADRIHGAVYRTRELVAGVQSYMHDVAPILPPPEKPPVDWGKNEPVDAPAGRWFVCGWMLTTLLAVVGLCIGIVSASMPSGAKWVPMGAVLLAGVAVMTWGTLRLAHGPTLAQPPAELECAEDVAWWPLPDVFTAIAVCPACKRVSAHALDVAHTGDGIGRVCECGYRWTQTVLNLAGQ